MTDSPSWRLIPLQPASGPFHMAADTYLTHHSNDTPVLRFYQWKPYAVSLGYHQDAHSIDADACRRNRIDLVRRPTGGRAILHAEELTYAVIIPVNSPEAKRGVHAIHNKISLALARGIRKCGVDIQLNETGTNLREHYTHAGDSMACFSSSTKYELQINGKKVVGSAQRRFSGGILQHGSILLGRRHTGLSEYLRLSPDRRRTVNRQLEQKTTELEQHLKTSIDPENLCTKIRDGFRQVFRCRFHEDPFTRAELQSIRDSSEKYRILPYYDAAMADSE